jgi:hypothetical protein
MEGESCELLWVKLQIQGISDLYIGSFYKPPKQTEEICLAALSQSIYRVQHNKDCHIWLGRDFNLGGIDWENRSVPTGSTNSKQSHQLSEIANDYGLEQIVISSTHFTASSDGILDLFFTNNSTLVN